METTTRRRSQRRSVIETRERLQLNPREDEEDLELNQILNEENIGVQELV